MVRKHRPGNGITLDGTRFELLQFHFHHGSEHTLDGAQLPMEMHLVHRSDRGALAVIGVLLGECAAWRYRGSLTTPPCTEGVSWIVMTEPVTLSAAQIAAFGALYARNYRPVQPLGRRKLGRDKGGHDE